MDHRILDRILVVLKDLPAPSHIYHICIKVRLLASLLHIQNRIFLYLLLRMNMSSYLLLVLPVKLNQLI